MGRGGIHPYQLAGERAHGPVRTRSTASPIASSRHPPKIVDSPLVRPVVGIRHQLFPQRILPHIGELLLVFDPVTHSMVKGFPLPCPRTIQMPTAELSLPKLDPLVYVEMEIVWRAKEMQVIRHEHVITDEPRRRFLRPDFSEGILDGRVSHPRNPVFGVHRDEENVRLPQENVRAGGGCLATDLWINSFASTHARRLRILRGDGK